MAYKGQAIDNQYIMSLVPKLKLPQANIRKGPKTNQMKSGYSELPYKKEQKLDTSLSQKNQEDLKYTQKRLNLKNNPSEHQPPKAYFQELKDSSQRFAQQPIQKDNPNSKYCQNQLVNLKNSQFQQADHFEDNERPYLMVFNDQEEHIYDLTERKISDSRQVKLAEARLTPPQGNTYQSLLQNDGKRMSSKSNYFIEPVSVSTNMNKHSGQFIDFLQGYVSDLNQSVHTRIKTNEDHLVDKQQYDQLKNSKLKQSAVNRYRHQKKNIDKYLRSDILKLNEVKKSDTFGQQKSKVILKSEQMQTQTQLQLQLKIKEEKLTNISLANEIQKLYSLLEVKQSTIKRLEVQNELFQEQLVHSQKRQQILTRKRKSSMALNDFRNLKGNDRNTRNQNIQYRDTGFRHYRKASANAGKGAVSYRSSFKIDDYAELFQKTNYAPQDEYRLQSRPRKKQAESLQRWQREYEQPLESERRDYRETRGKRAQKILN